ncbi:MAG: DNA-directed RNA polymerase subunit alpha C-terminal domain-containing protein [Chloroflexota bacterium]
MKRIDKPFVGLSFLTNLRAANVDLSKVDIELLDLSRGVLNPLKRANIRTIAQLASCTRADLLNLPTIGVTRVEQISREINAFLSRLFSDVMKNPQIQLPLGLKTPLPSPFLLPEQEFAWPSARFRDVFDCKVPFRFISLIPRVWKYIVAAVCKEPQSFAELELLILEAKSMLSKFPDPRIIDTYHNLRRVIRWLNKAGQYQCIDEEISHIVNNFRERELHIFLNRYKMQDPLTLQAIGEKLGVTRERVRQIQNIMRSKLITQVKTSTLMYSRAALYILKTQINSGTAAEWTRKLVDLGLLKDPKYLDLLIMITKATNSSELSF